MRLQGFGSSTSCENCQRPKPGSEKWGSRASEPLLQPQAPPVPFGNGQTETPWALGEAVRMAGAELNPPQPQTGAALFLQSRGHLQYSQLSCPVGPWLIDQGQHPRGHSLSSTCRHRACRRAGGRAVVGLVPIRSHLLVAWGCGGCRLPNRHSHRLPGRSCCPHGLALICPAPCRGPEGSLVRAGSRGSPRRDVSLMTKTQGFLLLYLSVQLILTHSLQEITATPTPPPGSLPSPGSSIKAAHLGVSSPHPGPS